MIERLNNNQVRDILKESSSRQPEPTMSSVNNQIDALLQVNCQSLIEKAKQPPQDDADAVQRAQELLLSGQLETPENIQAAAENIIKYGI
jgi:hypothetical protein